MRGKLQLRIVLVVVITGLVLGATLSVSMLHVTANCIECKEQALYFAQT